MIGKYTGKPKFDLITGEVYEVSIRRSHYVYELEVNDRVINYASRISIKQNWELDSDLREFDLDN